MTTDKRRNKILFVDDDPQVHDALSRALRSKQENWDMRWAHSALEALTHIEMQGPVDVVVTDLRMPGMDGTALLSELAKHHPTIIRIIYADWLDLPAALRSIPLAQQFLNAPLDAETLTNSIDRCMDMQACLNNPALKELLGRIDVLPSPPEHVQKLNASLLGDQVSMDEIASIISSDAAMTSKLLQLVNSAFFGLSHRITDVRQAVMFLGLATVRNLLAAVELVRSFGSNDPELMVELSQMHHHSLKVAELSRSLLENERHLAHDAFSAGMMHDIGLLALLSQSPALYKEIKLESQRSQRPLIECEMEIIGIPHSHLGAHLLDLWGLPYGLIETVARSHDADSIPGPTLTPPHAVFIAEQVVSAIPEDSIGEGTRMPDEKYLSALGLEESITSMVSRI